MRPTERPACAFAADDVPALDFERCKKGFPAREDGLEGDGCDTLVSSEISLAELAGTLRVDGGRWDNDRRRGGSVVFVGVGGSSRKGFVRSTAGAESVVAGSFTGGGVTELSTVGEACATACRQNKKIRQMLFLFSHVGVRDTRHVPWTNTFPSDTSTPFRACITRRIAARN